MDRLALVGRIIIACALPTPRYPRCASSGRDRLLDGLCLTLVPVGLPTDREFRLHGESSSSTGASLSIPTTGASMSIPLSPSIPRTQLLLSHEALASGGGRPPDGAVALGLLEPHRSTR